MATQLCHQREKDLVFDCLVSLLPSHVMFKIVGNSCVLIYSILIIKLSASIPTPFDTLYSTSSPSSAHLSNGFGSTGSSGQHKISFGVMPATGFGTFCQPQQSCEDELIYRSIWKLSMFGDRRDVVHPKYNYLQARRGYGTILDNRNIVPVNVTPYNFLCRFKTMGYVENFGLKNEMGLVLLTFNAIVDHQAEILNRLFRIFGTKPNHILNVVTTVPMKNDKIQIAMFAEEKLQTSNETRIMLATELRDFLNGHDLTNMGVVQVTTLIARDQIQLKEYLKIPPKGIQPEVWEQAKETNPDPTKFVPVPTIGFREVWSNIFYKSTS